MSNTIQLRIDDRVHAYLCGCGRLDDVVAAIIHLTDRGVVYCKNLSKISDDCTKRHYTIKVDDYTMDAYNNVRSRQRYDLSRILTHFVQRDIASKLGWLNKSGPIVDTLCDTDEDIEMFDTNFEDYNKLVIPCDMTEPTMVNLYVDKWIKYVDAFNRTQQTNNGYFLIGSLLQNLITTSDDRWYVIDSLKYGGTL